MRAEARPLRAAVDHDRRMRRRRDRDAVASTSDRKFSADRGSNTPRIWPSPCQKRMWRWWSKSRRACITLKRVSRKMSPTRSRCAGVRLRSRFNRIDQPAARHPEIAVAVCERAKRETNQKAREPQNQAEPDIRLSWQDRSQSAASPAPMDRPCFQKSCSFQETDSASPMDSLGTRAERYAALVANTNIAAAAAIGIIDSGRDISRDADANRRGRWASENSRRAGRDARAGFRFHLAVQHRQPSVRRCETQGRIWSIQRDARSIRRAVRGSKSLRQIAGNSCRASKQFMRLPVAPAVSIRSACLRRDCRARNARIFTLLHSIRASPRFRQRSIFAILKPRHHPVLGLQRVEQPMREVVRFASLFGLGHENSSGEATLTGCIHRVRAR